jgi:hypothetical protein
MDVAKPTGGYAERMLDPGGWPDVDAQLFYDRAQAYTVVLRQTDDVLGTCKSQRAEIFEGGIWSGSAAAAANAEFGRLIDEMGTLEYGLASVITWHKYVAQTVVTAKSDVAENVLDAHRTIARLENDPSSDADERSEAINTVVSTTHAANVSIVEGTAAQVLVSKSWKPPANALEDLLAQKTPPPVNIPNAPSGQPSWPTPSVPATPGTGGGLTPPPTPGTGGPPPPGDLPSDGGGLPPGSPTPGGQPGGPQPLTPTAPPPGAPGGMPGGGPAPLAPATPAAPLSPAAGAQRPGAGGAAGGPKGVTPAAASAGVLPASVKPGEEGAAAHGGGSGVPAAAMGSGGSGGSGSGARSGAYAQASGDRSGGTKPAAARANSQKSKPRAKPMHAAHDEEDAVVVMPAPVIPVSAARAERDAIAEASRRAEPDPLQLARRIGAALNAPDLEGGMDLGFFWVTGVTTDGAIVVANSYGLAYIPEGVQLPEKVHLASGDETILATERARWATYPVMAVRGWADHHGKTLRAVIGTAEQLANSDAGVATIVLSADDIPETGDMIGRSRLQVVDPAAAERLTATPDARLADLLPSAPAGAQAASDPQAAPAAVVDPEAAAVLSSRDAGTESMEQLLAEMPSGPDAQADDRFMLWFEVMKPLASNASGRQAAHLQAFQAYVVHAQDVLLREAHAAPDPAAQRSAVAEWMYWIHLTGLLNVALADPRILSPA